LAGFGVFCVLPNCDGVFAAVDDPLIVRSTFPTTQVLNTNRQLRGNRLAFRNGDTSEALEFLPGAVAGNAFGLWRGLDEQEHHLVAVDLGRVLDVYADLEHGVL